MFLHGHQRPLCLLASACRKICDKHNINSGPANGIVANGILRLICCLHVVLQDELAEGMVQEVQKLLWQLVCYTGNKSVVMSFVKGCLDNIEVNRYGFFTPVRHSWLY